MTGARRDGISQREVLGAGRVTVALPPGTAVGATREPIQ